MENVTLKGAGEDIQGGGYMRIDGLSGGGNGPPEVLRKKNVPNLLN